MTKSEWSDGRKRQYVFEQAILANISRTRTLMDRLVWDLEPEGDWDEWDEDDHKQNKETKDKIEKVKLALIKDWEDLLASVIATYSGEKCTPEES